MEDRLRGAVFERQPAGEVPGEVDRVTGQVDVEPALLRLPRAAKVEPEVPAARGRVGSAALAGPLRFGQDEGDGSASRGWEESPRYAVRDATPRRGSRRG